MINYRSNSEHIVEACYSICRIICKVKASHDIPEWDYATSKSRRSFKKNVDDIIVKISDGSSVGYLKDTDKVMHRFLSHMFEVGCLKDYMAG